MRTLDTIYTDHLVDDSKHSPFEAMQAFMQTFLLNADNVYAEGKIITYKIKHPRNAEAWEKSARLLIKQLNLPLEANLETWKRNGEVFEVNLCIEYRD